MSISIRRLTCHRIMRAAFVFALALGPSFACAESNDPPAAAPEPPGESTPLPEGGTIPDASEGGIPPLPGTCSEGGFCYVSVPPVGPLRAVSASNVDDAWMLAEQSPTLLHWDGTSLVQVYAYEGETPSNIAFTNIWAEKKDDVWAVATARDESLFLVRYASPAGGGVPTFRELRTEESASVISGLWASPDGDAVWIVTDRDVLRVHENASGPVVDHLRPTTGAGAEEPMTYAWRGVWGFGPDDVFVAGRDCPSGACDEADGHGVIAHYDGTTWSLATIEDAGDVPSIRGTPPGTDRQLWFDTREPGASNDVRTLHLAAVTADGQLAPPIYTHSTKLPPACSGRVGHVATPTAGWFSDGLLLCQWTGTKLDPTPTARGGIPVIDTLSGVWGNATDDTWIVGKTVTRDTLPAAGFAARRTATTAAKEGQP